MPGDPSDDASAILAALQTAVDSRDVDALISLSDESAVLIGAAGDVRNRDALRRY